jgi:hypothetical protein
MCYRGQLLWGKTLHFGVYIAPNFGGKIESKSSLKPMLSLGLNEITLKKTLARTG